MTGRRGTDVTIDERWSATPRIAGGTPAYGSLRDLSGAVWETPVERRPVAPGRDDPGRREPAAVVLGGWSLALAIVALGAGIVGSVVGVLCVGFIAAFGAPADVTHPAMAGFAFWGTVVTAPFFVASVVLLIVGICRKPRSWWWVAPSVLDAVTLLGLWVAVAFWYHPGVHISSDFSS